MTFQMTDFIVYPILLDRLAKLPAIDNEVSDFQIIEKYYPYPLAVSERFPNLVVAMNF